MRRYAVFIAAGIAAFSLPAAAEEVDMADLTCESVLSQGEAEMASLLMWTEGYYSGKQDTTMFDQKEFADGVAIVVEACKKDMSAKWLATIEGLAK
jgi:hypothetical protein